jgi:hypothetical protein
VTPTRWHDVGPLETTVAPEGFYARLDDEMSPAQTLHRSAAIAAVAAAEAPLPQPKAIEAVVFVDTVSRTASVRLPDTAGGFERALWIQAWQQLRRAQEAGWPADGPDWVYADIAGVPRVVPGLPVDGAHLSFTWPVGVGGFAALVGGPVTAVVTVDLSTHRFRSCRFLDR